MNTDSMRSHRLDGTVALVAGATRGAGKAIAIELGRAGAHVVVTGRSSRHAKPSTYDQLLAATGLTEMPGSVEETTEQIESEGGSATGIVCDHSDSRQVADLVDRLRTDIGRLDVVVNNPWGGHESFSTSGFDGPAWEQRLDQWEAMFDNGVRNHILTLHHVVPLMLDSGGRLVAAVTFSDRGRPLPGNLFYDVAKAAITRIATSAAIELEPHGITSVAVSPGFMRTELVLANFGVTEHDAVAHPALARSESPHYVGRGIVALSSDPDASRYSGRVVTAAELAATYGFTDIDGSRPTAFTLAPNTAEQDATR